MKIPYVETIRRSIALSQRAFGQFKGRILVLVFLAIIGGIFEGVGINALIPLFSLIVGADDGATDPISSYIQAFFEKTGVTMDVPYLLLFVAVIFIVTALITVLFAYVNMHINAQYEVETRKRLLRATLMSTWPYLMEQKLGYLEQVLLTDVVRSKNYLGIMSNSVVTLVNMLVYTIVAVSISPQITVVTFGLGALLFLAVRPFIKHIRDISLEESSVYKQLSHQVNEALVGMKTIKAMNAQKKVGDIGIAYFDRIKQLRIRLFFANAIPTHLTQPVSMLFILAVFYVYYQSPGFNFAALLVIIYLIKQIITYIKRLNTVIIGINSNYPFLKNVVAYEDQALAHAEKSKSGGKKWQPFSENISLEGICYRYADGSSAIHDVSLTIKKGETIGIIGKSGAGKTTLVDILLGLLMPTKGVFSVDGIPCDELDLLEYRKHVGYVSQDVFLFHDTIANNISFFDDTISEQDIIQAAKEANIYDFIMNTPDGFNTVIGERGVRLSGGQRQRISIARVLARKADILILDEATSSLDTESEVKIQSVIERLDKDMTVIIIAHRLSTVMQADRIVVLDTGAIVESGSPKRLLSEAGSYLSKIYALQSGHAHNVPTV